METCVHEKLITDPLKLTGTDKHFVIIRCAKCKQIVSVEQPYINVETFAHYKYQLEAINAHLKVIAGYVEHLKEKT